MKVVRAEGVMPQPSARDIFTGEVRTRSLADENTAAALRINLVRFSAGARTKWHRHSFEQGLLISEGRGIVATEKEAHEVAPGDLVVIPEGEKHWHGGTETSAMAHYSIGTPGETTVLEPVSRP